MIRKGKQCHAIINAIFLNKSQAEKSRKSHNERFALSTANFRTVGFFLSIDTKHCKFWQVLVYLSKYLIFLQIS